MFNKLIKYEQIGFYQQCNVVEIFLIKKDKIINLFMLYTLEDTKNQNKQNNEYVTEKPISLNGEYKFGVKNYKISLSEIKERYIQFHKNNFSSVWNEYAFHELDFQFIVSEDNIQNNSVNNVLLNNNASGAYILEFFDENKEKFDFLTTDNIKKIEKILDANNIPLKFQKSLERLGNVIIQFPITLFKVNKIKINDDDTGISLNFEYNSKLNRKLELYIEIISKLSDGSITRSIVDYQGKNSQIIPIRNINLKNIEIKIYDKNDLNLIYFYSKSGFIEKIIVDVSISMGNTYREFKYVHNKEVIEEKIKLTDPNPFIISSDEDNYKKYLEKSEYDEKIDQLTGKLDFKEYINDKNAKKDLIKLINENDSNGVYLMDPYLEPNDIFSTLLYSNRMNNPLKAITSNKVFKRKLNFEDNKNSFKNQFDNLNLNINHINLEFRIQHGSYGWEFHDRFLIFPKQFYESPVVYSLGTSINSFGKEHNILQKVLYPQSILNSFDKLWNQLDNEKCLIWKSK